MLNARNAWTCIGLGHGTGAWVLTYRQYWYSTWRIGSEPWARAWPSTSGTTPTEAHGPRSTMYGGPDSAAKEQGHRIYVVCRRFIMNSQEGLSRASGRPRRRHLPLAGPLAGDLAADFSPCRLSGVGHGLGPRCPSAESSARAAAALEGEVAGVNIRYSAA